MILAADPSRVEADLHAGALACPFCGGRLRGWSSARARTVRQLSGPPLVVRPRRVRCQDCTRTQVVLPSGCLPRRADATEVITNALHASATGRGHRRIAADLNRSPSTVRRWLRAVRGAHIPWLHRRAVDTIAEIEPDLLNQIYSALLDPAASQQQHLRAALSVLGAAVAAIRTRLPDGPCDAWALIGTITGGQLLSPARSG